MISDRLMQAVQAEIDDLEEQKNEIDKQIATLIALYQVPQAAPKPKPNKRQTARERTRKAAQEFRETREATMLRIVRQHGEKGVTIREIANEMGLKDATGLYRVAKRLVSQGHLLKTGQYLTPRVAD